MDSGSREIIAAGFHDQKRSMLSPGCVYYRDTLPHTRLISLPAWPTGAVLLLTMIAARSILITSRTPTQCFYIKVVDVGVEVNRRSDNDGIDTFVGISFVEGGIKIGMFVFKNYLI